MISAKTIKAIEYDKILSHVSEYAVLDNTKDFILNLMPASDITEAEFLLSKTKEAYKLLYTHSVSGIYYCDDVSDELDRVDKGGTLINGELLRVANNLKSARIIKNAIQSVNDEELKFLPEIASRLYINHDFEKEIASKIISEDEISDNASPKLASIRKNIRNLNAKIRDKLNSYIRGGSNKYLQDAVVTMRRDRYVIPVKSEYRSFIKGFVHDQSSSGATVFIEPEYVMELNNELKTATFEESAEMRRILAELSAKITNFSDAIRYNYQNISDLDCSFAKATYSFKNKCTYPILNDKGIIDIKKGRHPLIDKDRVVPVSVSFGEKYNFLLITGPNTGGKTVTLKLSGLLSLMAMSGLYVPAQDESKISVWSNVFCDIGDEQSIEQSLSTFSSHIKNIKDILDKADNSCLVLIDEIGAGTDPEEGSALALSIIEKLLEKNCFGIITTHYSKLKEFAVDNAKIENASMEFDSKTLLPVYKLNIGIPGSSNAIDIAKILGVDKDIIDNATSHLSTDKIMVEKILKKAEESRRETEKLKAELDQIKQEKEKELNEIRLEKDKIIKERERIYNNAKQETKSIVADKLVEAEEIIDELKAILKKADLESKEVFRASELKNRIKNSRYLDYDVNDKPIELVKSDLKKLKVGDTVYVNSLGRKVVIDKIRDKKGEAEVRIGDIKTVVKLNDLYNTEKTEAENKVFVNKGKATSSSPKAEINILGLTALEAETEIVNFIDQAVMNGLEEIKIIHGVGQGVLIKTVRDYLKTDKNVLEFRRGKYGEGENGVTIIKLK